MGCASGMRPTVRVAPGTIDSVALADLKELRHAGDGRHPASFFRSRGPGLRRSDDPTMEVTHDG